MRTYNVKLCIDDTSKVRILETLNQTREAYNFVSTHMQNTETRLTYRIHDETYHTVRKLLPDLPSQYVIKARMEAVSAFKSLKSNQKKQQSEKIAFSCRLDKRLFSLKQEDEKLKIRITATGGKRIEATLLVYPKFTEMMQHGVICDPLVFERNGDLWLAVPFEEIEPEFVPGKVVGIDLGMRRLAVTSEGKAFCSSEHLKARRKARYLKSQLQSKGSKSAKRKLKTVRRKERNISRDCCMKLSNSILSSTNCTTIAMEDLSGIKDKKKGKRASNARSQVCYHELRRILTYKAPLSGRKVVTVDPAYTSQDDHRGHVRGTRKGCRYYANDGIVFDADWNAAINIAERASKQFKSSKRPVSFSLPVDGGLDFTGRLLVDQPNVAGSLSPVASLRPCAGGN